MTWKKSSLWAELSAEVAKGFEPSLFIWMNKGAKLSYSQLDKKHNQNIEIRIWIAH